MWSIALAYTAYDTWDDWQCLGRVSDPEHYPECYDTHPRSSNRHKFPECHPNCHLPYLALNFKKEGFVEDEETQALLNSQPKTTSELQMDDHL